MENTQPKYDVAISFLAKDEPIAAALRDKLSEGLEVFFFPRNQEELAGTNGLESMRIPFLTDSRIALVLYRDPWGKTPWTRVEQTAIQESCLNNGWHRLFFIALDKTSTLPLWLPQTHVRLNYEDYGLEQAVGAIKARVEESGGVVERLTPSKQATLYEQEALYNQDKAQLNSGPGLKIVEQKVAELFAEIERHCAEINTHKHLVIRVGADRNDCILTTDRISLSVGWRQRYTNTLDDCVLEIQEFDRRMQLPGEPHLMFIVEATQLQRSGFVPELSRARECGWTEKPNGSQFFSSIALAEKCVNQFLDLARRDNAGTVKRPNW